MTRLDRFACGMIALGALFIAWVVPVPFLLWTMTGSAVLLARAWYTRRKDLAGFALLMPILAVGCAVGNWIGVLLTPHTVDAALLATDFGISSRVCAWVFHHNPVWQILRVAYYSLPVWMAVVLAWADKPKEFMRRMVLAAVAAVPFYLLCPAVGPVWVHTADAPRNCMPSLHFAWAILAWWYSPRWLRVPSAVLVALIGSATIGLGEHYIVDLIAAVPFTIAVVAVPLRRRESKAGPKESQDDLPYRGITIRAKDE